MRVFALVAGMFGGFMGVYFAQLLVAGSALFGAIAGAFGSQSASAPLGFGVAALACYTLGIIGGVLALSRPRAAGLIMLLAASGGVIATIAIGPAVLNAAQPAPTPTPLRFTLGSPVPTPRLSAPPAAGSTNPLLWVIAFGGPALLVLGAILALTAEVDEAAELVPTGGRRFAPAAPTPEPASAPPAADALQPDQVADYRPFEPPRSGEIVDEESNVMLDRPGMYAASRGRLPIGARVTLLGETGNYYFIDRAGVRGWVSKRGVR